MKATKIMLDTQIYDLIIDTPGLVERLNKLSRANKVVILCTHIQEDELARIPDEQKRAAIAMIIRNKVPTNGAVYDVSRYGEATYGEASLGGVSIDNIRSSSKKHTEDALIATTAEADADVLVTEDRRLKNRMRVLSSRCEMWGFGQFMEYIWPERCITLEQ